MSFYIRGTGSCVPQRIVSNDDLTKIMDTSDEWIFSHSGIKTRRVATTETVRELTANSARLALADAGLAASDIDMIICSTLRGDYITPAAACVVGEELGINAPAFDINGACSGMLYGFEVANGIFALGKAKNILLVTAELLSKITNWEDRSTCVLFGDGAAALVLSAGDGLLSTHLACTCNSEVLNAPHTEGRSPFNQTEQKPMEIYMAGQAVYKFAVGTMVSEIEAAAGEAGIALSDIDWVLPHQANIRIIDGAAKRLGIDRNKILTNIDAYGNVSSSSIAILLDEQRRKGTFKKGDKLVLVAFGAGLTSAASVIEWKI